jgi:tRNA-(ms[2]io[6]A)-hydroxylase
MGEDSDVAEKRRLPVIQSAPNEGGGGDGGDADEARPAWQWVGFGVVAMFAAWLPLAAAAGMVGRNWAEKVIGAPLDEADALVRVGALDHVAQRKLMLALMVPHVAALALAGAFAGFVIGKFGQGGVRSASVAAAIVCALAGLIAVRDVSSFLALLVVLLVAVLSARAGVAVGQKRRT